MNNSVRNVAEVARRYGYKLEIVVVSRIGNGRAYLSASEPFLRSPYPKHFTSAVRSLNYVEIVFNEDQN